MPIKTTDLRDVDLNLLVAFEALMQTRSVTRAAEQLRISQPSASHALKRLRDLVGDPLFARTPSGMTPTPRALYLAQPVRDILSSIESTLFAGSEFDPARETRIFRIAATDYAQAVIAEPLLAILRSRAPGCRLILTATDCDRVTGSLERGEVDLAFGAFPQLNWSSHQALLYRESYACIFDPVACAIDGDLTLARWLELPHAIMSTRGDYTGPLDEVLRASGLKRQVAVSTPSFLAIPLLVKGKPMVAALPSRLAERYAAPLGLATCPVPFDSGRFAVTALWTARTAKEPGMVWLREQVAAIAGTPGD